MKLTGEQVHALSQKFDAGESLTDSEIEDLIAGLQFLLSFFRAERFSPMVLYYAIQIERLERVQWQREVYRSYRPPCLIELVYEAERNH